MPRAHAKSSFPLDWLDLLDPDFDPDFDFDFDFDFESFYFGDQSRFAIELRALLRDAPTTVFYFKRLPSHNDQAG